MSDDAIRVFISYSWDSEEHKDKVYHLAQALRDDGIDCIIDQFVQSPDNWDRWMLDQIDESTFVLIICTTRYYQRYRGKEEVNKGLGVTWESTLIMGRIYNAQGRNTKFYPIFLDTPNRDIIPDGIRTTFYDLSGHDLLNLDNDKNRLIEDRGYKELYRLLTKQPAVIPRKLGSLKKLETVDREIEQRTKQERLQREQQRQAEEPHADDLSFEQFGANYYGRLEDLLKAGKWKQADGETYEVMIRAIGKKSGDHFEKEELLNFSCIDLKIIDQLWEKYSNGQFGFSVQKQIYVECGGKLDAASPGVTYWREFGEKVGWLLNNSWIYYENVTFNTLAPKGHLPTGMGGSIYGCWWGWQDCFPYIAFRLVDCKI